LSRFSGGLPVCSLLSDAVIVFLCWIIATGLAAMPGPVNRRPGRVRDPDVAQLFSNDDPEQLFCDLREVGHGNFGAVYYVSIKLCISCDYGNVEVTVKL